jgi:hypothetical protein
MEGERAFWSLWARKLQRWGIDQFAALLLDAAGPLKVLLAQVIVAGSPFFISRNNQEWQALEHLLEDPQESSSFASFLRQEDGRWT